MRDPALARFEALYGPEFGHGLPIETNRIDKALAALGDPHLRAPPVIHVAGTNGKGSTIAFMNAIAAAHGKTVHAFTQPHLIKLNERFQLAGAPVTDEALIDAAERIAATGVQLTQFEAQTAAAFLLFAEHSTDLALLETGMGGRDDATNVIARPKAVALTPIAHDHVDVLGPSIADIAAHKAGVLKRNAIAICARQQNQARDVINAIAEGKGVRVLHQGEDWDAYPAHGRLVVQTETRALDLPLPALAGAHQIDNAGLAIATLLAANLFPLEDAAVARALRSAHWPGRLQLLHTGALAQPVLEAGGELWVDGGHNPHAAEALARWAAQMHARRPLPLRLIIAMRARKDWRAFVDTLAPHAAHATTLWFGNGFVPANALAKAARDAGLDADTATDITDAIKNAPQLPATRFLICGSLALAGQALEQA